MSSFPYARYDTEEQKEAAERAIAAFSARKGGARVYTDLEPAKEWYDAEDYHQVGDEGGRAEEGRAGGLLRAERRCTQAQSRYRSGMMQITTR